MRLPWLPTGDDLVLVVRTRGRRVVRVPLRPRQGLRPQVNVPATVGLPTSGTVLLPNGLPAVDVEVRASLNWGGPALTAPT